MKHLQDLLARRAMFDRVADVDGQSLEQHPGLHVQHSDLPAFMPRGNGVNAPEAPSSCDDMSLQNWFNTVAEQQVHGTDDARTCFCGSVVPARTLCSSAINKFCFADRTHFRQSIGPIHRAALNVYARHDLVTCVEIGHHVIEEMPVPWNVYQVMMWIHNRQFWLLDVLGPQRKPLSVDGDMRLKR